MDVSSATGNPERSRHQSYSNTRFSSPVSWLPSVLAVLPFNALEVYFVCKHHVDWGQLRKQIFSLFQSVHLEVLQYFPISLAVFLVLSLRKQTKNL